MKWSWFVLGGLTLVVAVSAGVMWTVEPSRSLAVIGSGVGVADGIGGRSPDRSKQNQPLPDLRFVDGSGTARSLSEFRGRFVLLNVWATWCTPCRKEMPSLDRLQQALGSRDFEVVALSIDRGGVAAVEPFYEEMELRSLGIYVDARADALGALAAVGIPVTLLVDSQGREVWRLTGTLEWDSPVVIEHIQREIRRRSGRMSGASSGGTHGLVS